MKLLDTADMKISADTEGSKREIDLFNFHSFPLYKIKQHFFTIVRLINRWSKRSWKLYIKENFVKYKIDYFIPLQFNQINRTINLRVQQNAHSLFISDLRHCWCQTSFIISSRTGNLTFFWCNICIIYS
jgi:hypothetical protein